MEQQSERIRAGKARARAEGKPNGGGVKKGTVLIPMEIQKNVISLFIDSGWGVGRVCRQCGIGNDVFYKILRKHGYEDYIGAEPESLREGRVRKQRCNGVPASVHSENG